jgi:hypothetical protein
MEERIGGATHELLHRGTCSPKIQRATVEWTCGNALRGPRSSPNNRRHQAPCPRRSFPKHGVAAARGSGDNEVGTPTLIT